jgi:hypothetical protein
MKWCRKGIEVSLQAYESETRDGGHWYFFALLPQEAYIVFLVLVIATCEEHGIATVAYSYALLSPLSPLSDPKQPSWARFYLLAKSRTV